jgi:hypothetical protein
MKLSLPLDYLYRATFFEIYASRLAFSGLTLSHAHQFSQSATHNNLADLSRRRWRWRRRAQGPTLCNLKQVLTKALSSSIFHASRLLCCSFITFRRTHTHAPVCFVVIHIVCNTCNIESCPAAFSAIDIILSVCRSQKCKFGPLLLCLLSPCEFWTFWHVGHAKMKNYMCLARASACADHALNYMPLYCC